ncbi:MAG TPA: P-loop NTPase [Gaiellaceae bacterium]|jgi:capsular exopolysaccharide synthesis family protein|nr:P-loop NTPase [Gaiellaceae bacterium]
MEFKDLVRTLRRFRLAAAAVFLATVAIGAAAAFLPAERYRATATLLVEPSGGDVDFSDVEAVRFLLPALSERVDTSAFQAAVRSRVPPAIADEDVTLSATVEQGTGLVKLSAEGLRPRVVPVYANVAARTLIQQKVSKRIQISVLDAADVPHSPSSPRKVPILLGSALLGLILAVFSALATHALWRDIRDAEEVRDEFGLEVLAEIPQSRAIPTRVVELFNGAGDPRLVEAFQRLRTNLGIVGGREKLAITVTSCGPGEGKSTVTANLAWVLASLGPHVVAIDCDLRRPALHTYLGVNLERGIGSADGLDPRLLAQPTALSSLSVVAAGTTDRHPTEVLYKTLPRALEVFRDRTVLIDTPPMLGVAESTLIATMTGAVLLVIDGKRTTRSDLEQVLHDLRRADVRVLGAVVNRGKPVTLAPYYYTKR